MKVFGICYVVFGLMAVIGAVLDADGVMAVIRRLPKRWMDHICETMYKFIMGHRPGLLVKLDLPHVDTIPKDRLYQIDFRIGEADVAWMLEQGKPSRFFEEGCIPVSYTDRSVLEKYIRDRVRHELFKSVVDLTSVRVSNLPSGGCRSQCAALLPAAKIPSVCVGREMGNVRYRK